MMLRTIFKYIAGLLFIPVTKWYLRKTRKFRYKTIRMEIDPGVFHPGLFQSTRFLASFIENLPLKSRSVLELGSGAGLLSVIAANAGAQVTASDLNRKAVENTKRNAMINGVAIDVIESDLFDNIPGKFDFIVINPPYYAHPVRNEEELAWHCGANFEYFQKLFLQMPHHIHQGGLAVMVLSGSCDLDKIKNLAAAQRISFRMVKETPDLFEGRQFIFELCMAT